MRSKPGTGQETNITRESQGTEKDAETVQWKVIDELKRDERVDLVFDDDNPGEAADVIAIKVIGGLKTPERVEIELLHCKFSGTGTAGARVKDLYEVCGQAQTSIWWAAAILKKQDLLAHMLKREEQRKRKYGTSRIERDRSRSFERFRILQHSYRSLFRSLLFNRVYRNRRPQRFSFSFFGLTKKLY